MCQKRMRFSIIGFDRIHNMINNTLMFSMDILSNHLNKNLSFLISQPFNVVIDSVYGKKSCI